MNFNEQLNKIKEFYYFSMVRYGFSDNQIKFIQKISPQSDDSKDFYIGPNVPRENPPNYNFKTTIGAFKNSIEKHKIILRNNCIILLISFWEDYCKRHKLKKYFNENILEVCLYRNCLIHSKGIIDKRYMKSSKLKKYPLGYKLEFSDKEFGQIMSYFE